MPDDIEKAEYAFMTALQDLRLYGTDRSTSVYMRNRWRKIILGELDFLRENDPSSYVLSEDISDVDLNLE